MGNKQGNAIKKKKKEKEKAEGIWEWLSEDGDFGAE